MPKNLHQNAGKNVYPKSYNTFCKFIRYGIGRVGKRHCPSVAIAALRNSPFLALTIKQVGVLNKVFGIEIQKSNSIMSPKINHIHFFNTILIFINAKVQLMDFIFLSISA